MCGSFYLSLSTSPVALLACFSFLLSRFHPHLSFLSVSENAPHSIHASPSSVFQRMPLVPSTPLPPQCFRDAPLPCPCPLVIFILSHSLFLIYTWRLYVYLCDCLINVWFPQYFINSMKALPVTFNFILPVIVNFVLFYI